MRFNGRDSSVALNRPLRAMALLLAVVCTLFASGNETRAQAAVPAAPTGLTAPTVAHDSVTLVWDDPGDSSITGYLVLRRSRDGDEYGDGRGASEFAAIADDTRSSAITYTDTSVAPRTRYVYRVKAINSAGTSGQSGYLNVETLEALSPTSPPSMPTGLAVSSASHDSVTLVWDDPGDSSITGYQVLRRSRDGDEYRDGRGASEFAAIADDTRSSATTYTDTSVAPRTRYVYRVKARNPHGLSEKSIYANGKTPDTPQPAPPPTPTGLAVSSATHDSVTLTWDDPGDSTIESYQVLRRPRDGDEYGDGLGATGFVVIVDDTGSPAITYTDASVTARTRYVYGVKARNPHGLSEVSSPANAETSDAPTSSMPTGLAVSTASHDSVTLTWDDPGDSSITGYQVLRRSRDGDEYGDGLGAAEFVVIVGNTGSPGTTYTDTSVAARTRYVYGVKARNSQGLSEASSSANAETTDTPQPAPPSTPMGLAVSSASHDSVTLTWDDPGDSTIESYQVLRRSRDGDEYGDGLGDTEFVVIVDDTGSPDTTYTDTSVTQRTRYAYGVKARNPQGLSDVSSPANGETLEAPSDTPQSLVRGSRPNVVLILADDLGWGDILSNNPDSAMTTPRIDGIAASGANFTDAHSPSSMCSPTRYGLLTGRYAWRTWLSAGVLGGSSRPMIGPDRPTLGTLLQGQGYRTAAIGKWHLGMDFARLSDIDKVTEVNKGVDFDADIVDSPIDHGFDEFFGTSANLNWQPHIYIRDRRFLANPDRESQPDSAFYGVYEVLDRLTDEAVSFIERAGADDEQFFLYLPLNAPHVPLAPNDHFHGQTDLGLYGDFVAQIDWMVGQVLDALKRVGEYDNTIVIFTSDNGSFMRRVPNHVSSDQTTNSTRYEYRVGTHQSNGDWKHGKGSIYEGGHRIPFLWQWPAAIEAGSAFDTTISLADMYATLADILGQEPPPGVAPDSVSLLPLLLGETETRGAPVVHQSTFGEIAIRDGRWKLLLTDPLRLYDLEQDPGEDENVAAAHPEVVAELKTALAGIRAAEDGTLSGEATLRSLRLAGIDLGTLDPEVRSYAATVDREIATVEVIAIPTDTDARVGISTPNGRLLFGKPLRGRVEVELADPTTTIRVRVIAADGSANSTYTVTVTRAGPPTISGTTRVGETLTVDTSGVTDPDGLDNPEYTYQWVRFDGSLASDIAGATGATYVLTAEDQGKTIRVRVSFTDNGGYAETRSSAATPEVPAVLTVEVQRVPDSHNGSGTFDVRVLFSEPVSVSHRTLQEHSFEVSNGTVEATRRVNGRDDLREITVQPYTNAAVVLVLPPTADCTIEGAVCTGDGRPLSSRLEITVPGSPANSPAQGSPTIRGASEVGQILTVDTSSIADEDGLTGATFSYQWVLFNGNAYTDIQGATDSTYILVSDDEGKAFKVRVSFTDDAGYKESVTSALFGSERPYGLNASESDGAVVLTWRLPAGWTHGSTFQILRNRPELGETAPLVYVRYTESGANTYTDTDVEPGVLYVYRVKGVDPFGYTHEASEPVEIRTTESTPVENRPATGDPTISGTVQVGETLSADTSGIADAEGLDNAVFSYQWLADDAEIQDATDSTYVLDTDDEGKAIKVRVSFTDDAGNDETLTSAPTAQVAASSNHPATGPPTIRGQARVGATLRASLSALDDADGLSGATFTYQWLADDADTQDATNSTYVLDAYDEGKTIRVRVSFTDDAGNDETLTSAPTAQVAASSNHPATGPPTIRGQARVGATLRASLSALDDADGLSGATFTYQWLADDAEIRDATDSTYGLDADDAGKTIRVRVIFTDGAGNEETLTSTATSVVVPR